MSEENKEKHEEQRKPEEAQKENQESPKKEEKNPLEEKVKELESRLHEANSKYEEADKSADEWKNKYYQAYADMANTRKAVDKENADFKKYAVKSFIEELIPSLDSFDMALKQKPEDEKLRNYLKGFEMIQSKLLNTLKSVGVEIIDPKVGDTYDPHKMQAFSTVDGEENDKVAEVYTKGYQLYEHMLRPAGVIITKKAAKEKAEDIPIVDEDEKKDEADKKESK